LRKNIIVGIDLAGTAKNPTGWAMWENKVVSVCHLYKDEEILRRTIDCDPALIAVDAPLSLPAKGIMRRADREMYKRGYPVFPPRFPSMEKLTLRAMGIAQEIVGRGFDVIEVHPTSTRKALNMPAKDWDNIQTLFLHLGLKGDLETRALTPHEIDAITAALTGHLYLQGKTELVGNEKEGYIVVPLKRDWKRLQL
jgi:hypothetical protein